MDFLQNPFHILSATPQDNRRRIMELADTRSLVHDPDVCREAAATLTHPRRRLSAEMAWMLGVLPKHVNSVLRYLESSVRNLIGMDKLAQFRNRLGVSKMIPIATANLLAAGLSRLPDYPSDVVASWIVEIAATSEDITPEQVRAVINVERKVSGFPIVNLPDIEAEIQNLRDYYRQVMTSALDYLSVKERAGAMTVVVESATDDEKQLPRLIDRLVNWYEVEAQESLEEHERKIEELDEKLRFEADEERPDSALAPVVDQLIQTVKIWDVIAQPIQVSKKSQGLPHDASSRVARRLRDLAVHLFNEYDKLNFSRQLTNMLQEVFAEIGEVAEQLIEDARTLTKVAYDRARLNVALEQFEKIKAQVGKLRAEADAKGSDYFMNSMVNELIQSVKEWEPSAQPIEANHGVSNLVRGLALHLWNEHQKLDFSLQLTKMLQEVFAEVGDIANRIAEDRKVLNQLAQQHARMIKTSANESYSAGFYGCLWPLGILFILGILGALFENC